MDAVEGFSPETMDFLWGIRMNNIRDWFLEHKKAYIDSLYEPMKALGRDLYAPFANIPNLQMKVSRIYRDARMHHPDPYKESLWLCLRQDVEWWGENPCLYLEINPQGVDYGFFFWKPRSDALERFRRDMEADPAPLRELLQKARRETGMDLQVQLYKRPKVSKNPDAQEFFAWKGMIGMVRHLDPGPEMFGPELKDRAAGDFAALYPVFAFFTRYGA